MQAISKKLIANVLHVSFDVDVGDNKSIKSEEYLINNFASFQVLIECPNIYVKFIKLHKSDPLNYAIKLFCDQFSIKNKIFNECNVWHVMHVSDEVEYVFDLTIHLDVLPITNSFPSLHTDTELTDFELRGEDGSVQIHKVILAASSPVFRKMISEKWRGANEGHIDIKDTSMTTLQHLKDYVYLHTLPDTGLKQLSLLASCYMMPDLVQKCVDKLMLNMTARNAGELLKFAAQHEVTRLWLAVLASCSSGTVKEMWEYFFEHELP